MSMAATHLAAGRDVIVPQFLDSDDEIAGFRAIAEETGSGFRKIVIMDTKRRSVARFEDRGAGDGAPWHGQVKVIVEQGGGLQLLEAMYDGLVGGLQNRPAATVIRSTYGAIEETYEDLISTLVPGQAEARL